ncbi:MAG: hypothetical protein JST11_08070 [Acidobacteria bacterium]|nr:hypothetical protein [Acidobacteriota bacterium]
MLAALLRIGWRIKRQNRLVASASGRPLDRTGICAGMLQTLGFSTLRREDL